MRRLLVLLLLGIMLSPMPSTANRIDEIAVIEGVITRDIFGDNATIIPIQNFEYMPGWLIYFEYTLTTNASSYFTDITYANTMSYRTQLGTLINAMARVELTNNSYDNGINTLDLLGEEKIEVYLSAEIVPDTRQGSEIELDYKLVILGRNEAVVLDETKEYMKEISYYPDTLSFTNSYIGTNKDDIYLLMPEFIALNESRLPDNYHYIMDIIIQFTIELFDTESTDLTFSIPPLTREAKIEIAESGQYEITLGNMENREIQNLNIYHDGSDMILTIDKVMIDIPALVDVPQDLIIPLSIKISASISALVFFFLPYKIVDTYGKRQIRNIKEELY